MQDLNNPIYQPLPSTEECEYMPIDDWQTSCVFGGFTDDDGIGRLATENQMSNLIISPSQCHASNIPDWATHIVWFNK